MRKIRVVLFLLLGWLLSACSAQGIVFSDTYVFGQDAQNGFFLMSGYSDLCCVAESENGYYFMSGPGNWFLYFFDKETKKVVPVCNKPNCLHASETEREKLRECNALFGNVESLRYYMGNLYYVQDSPSESAAKNIYMVSKDGTGRKTYLECREYITGMQIHRGAIYFSTSDLALVLGEGNTISSFKLYKHDIGKAGAKPEILFEGSGEHGSVGNIICCGNNVFFCISYMQDNEDIDTIYRYNIRTKTLDVVVEKASNYFTVFNGSLVYIKNKGSYACDLDGGNTVKINDSTGLFFSNDNYLFIDNVMQAAVLEGVERTLTIVDKDWKTVKTVSLAGMKMLPLGCSNAYYFIPEKVENTDFGQTIPLMCIPLDGSVDDMKVTTFYEYVPTVPFAY